MDNVESSSLFRLPRELRDEIYSYVFEARTEPPVNPSVNPFLLGNRTRLGHNGVPESTLKPKYPRLIAVNRQLTSEYLEFVESCIAAGPVNAELDVMFQGYCSWPTWTYLPPSVRPEQPFNLVVNLRIFSTEAFRDIQHRPGTALKDLYGLLHHLVNSGPSFAVQASSLQDELKLRTGRLYRINRLSVNVSFRDDYTPDTWPKTVHKIFKMLKELTIAGLARGLINTVHAHAEYDQRNEKKIFDAEWDVLNVENRGKVMTWRRHGFLDVGQKSIAFSGRSTPQGFDITRL